MIDSFEEDAGSKVNCCGFIYVFESWKCRGEIRSTGSETHSIATPESLFISLASAVQRHVIPLLSLPSPTLDQSMLNAHSVKKSCPLKKEASSSPPSSEQSRDDVVKGQETPAHRPICGNPSKLGQIPVEKERESKRV